MSSYPEHRCESCKFYVGGNCRRHPPVYDRASPNFACWPAVGPKGWCGEFVNKSRGAKYGPR